jgi:hypothetical protein
VINSLDDVDPGLEGLTVRLLMFCLRGRLPAVPSGSARPTPAMPVLHRGAGLLARLGCTHAGRAGVRPQAPPRSGSSGRQPSQPSLAVHDGVRGHIPLNPLLRSVGRVHSLPPLRWDETLPPCGGSVSHPATGTSTPSVEVVLSAGSDSDAPRSSVTAWSPQGLRRHCSRISYGRCPDAGHNTTASESVWEARIKTSVCGRGSSPLQVSPKSTENRHRFSESSPERG